jgi:hypothetical protein
MDTINHYPFLLLHYLYFVNNIIHYLMIIELPLATPFCDSLTAHLIYLSQYHPNQPHNNTTSANAQS